MHPFFSSVLSCVRPILANFELCSWNEEEHTVDCFIDFILRHGRYLADTEPNAVEPAEKLLEALYCLFRRQNEIVSHQPVVLAAITE